MFAQIGRALDSVMQILGHFVFVLALWSVINAVTPFDASKISPEMNARIQVILLDVFSELKSTMYGVNTLMYTSIALFHNVCFVFMQLVNLYLAGIFTGLYGMGVPPFKWMNGMNSTLAEMINSCWHSNATYCFPLAPRVLGSM